MTSGFQRVFTTLNYYLSCSSVQDAHGRSCFGKTMNDKFSNGPVAKLG